MNFVMKFFLLFLLTFELKGEKCDKKILETYGIISLIEPAKQNLVFCPNIKSSCCPSYEQFKMFMAYQNEVKPHYIRLTNLLRNQLDRLDKAIKPLFQEKGEIEQKIEKIKEKPIKRQAEYLLSKLKPQSFSFYVEKAKLRLNRALTYTSSLKSTFFCTICDYESQNFMDLKKGTVTITDDTCDEIVQHTLMYSNIINRGIVAYLQDLSELMNKIEQKNKHIQMPGFQEVSSALNECSQEFKETEEELSSCKKYCGYFRLNADLPVFEGYPEFFLNVLVQLHMNFPQKQKPKRILEVLINIDNDHQDYDFQSSKKRHNKIEQALKMLDDERILSQEDIFKDDLSVSSLRKRKMSSDPYDEELSYPDFDDHMMANMLEIQKVFLAGEPSYLKKQIKKHYVKSYEPEIEDIEDDIIFKVAPDEKVQLEKLQAKFSFDGINLSKIIEVMDWDLQFHDIVLSLTGKEGDPSNELIDKDLLYFMNNVQNHNVKDFHSDNYIEFNDDKEFILLDYKTSKNEYEQMKQTQHKNQFEYTHSLLKQYNLENVDKIIQELENKHVSKQTAQAKTMKQFVEQKIDQAELKLHELVKEQEIKSQQEQDYQANKEFLKSLLKKKGLKGVIQDLKNSNKKTASETTPEQVNQQPTDQTTTNQPQNIQNDQTQPEQNQSQNVQQTQEVQQPKQDDQKQNAQGDQTQSEPSNPQTTDTTNPKKL